MPEQRTCQKCLAVYWWPAGRWQHDDIHCPPKKQEVHPEPVAINTVSNARAINTDAINAADIGARSGNRRDRADYNEYMRGYMKRKRAQKKIAKVAAGAAR